MTAHLISAGVAVVLVFGLAGVPAIVVLMKGESHD